MTGWQLYARSVCGATLVAAGLVVAPLDAHAQIGGSGRLADPYQQTAESRVLLLTTLRGPGRRLNTLATQSLAQQIRTRIPVREVYLVPKARVDEILSGSSFATDSALSPMDARLLGQQVRADEFLDGFVVELDGRRGYQMRGRLYLLGADVFMYEPLPDAAPGEELRHAADALVESLKEVRKQIPHERECRINLGDRKLAEAESAARAGIAAYPPALIARLCLMASLSAQKKGPDAILAVAHEVLARDSMYRHALAYAVDAYREKNDTANYVSHALRLVSVDIGNATLVENIVQTLAEMHRADIAVPTIDKAIEVSPLEVKLHTLRVLLLISAERWKDAAARSEELLRLDPAAADSAFFVKLSVAYLNDSQPDKSAATLKLATEQFPRNAFLHMLYGQELGRAGQTQGAIAEYKAAIEIDPKLPNVRTFVALAYQQLEQPDSTMAWLRLAHQAKEDSVTIAGMARSIGGRYYTLASQSKELADFRKAIPPLAFADSILPTNDGKWVWALSEYNIAAKVLEQLQATPSCETARDAKKSVDIVPVLIRAGGGQVDGATAGQIMGAVIQQFTPYVEAQIAVLCKPTQ